MINPSKDRLSYSELLKPPVGYKVEFAVGTTYSLELEALLGVPISLCLSEEMEDSFIKNPIAIIEGIRRASDKFIIFCEGGQIKVPTNQNYIYSLMEDSIFQVALENNKSFHPKIWILKYVNENGEEIYRIIVLSRNLTFDRSWDMVVCLDGKRNRRKTLKNEPLQKFLMSLLSFTNEKGRKKHLEKLINELYYVHFSPNDNHYNDFEFLPIGIEEYDKTKTGIFEKYHGLLIISPFLSSNIVSELNKLSLKDASKTLITRKSEIYKLDENILEDMDVYVLKDVIVDGEESLSEDEDTSWKKQDIHAKYYVKRYYNDYNFYIGSANCSNNAFNGNVEFMIKLSYKRRGFKLEQLLSQLFGEDEKENPFEKVEEILPQPVESKIIDELEKAIKELCRANLRGQVIENNDKYNIEIKIDKLKEGIKCYISPINRPKYETLMDKRTIIKDLSLVDLGEFYIIKVEKNGERVQRILKIPMKNIPKERDNQIFKNVIGDKVTFLKYISFLLADDFLLETLEQLERENSRTIGEDNNLNTMPFLYENMIKSASRNPDRIYEIDDIIKKIDDDKIITKEFRELYKAVSSAVTKKGKK